MPSGTRTTGWRGRNGREKGGNLGLVLAQPLRWLLLLHHRLVRWRWWSPTAVPIISSSSRRLSRPRTCCLERLLSQARHREQLQRGRQRGSGATMGKQHYTQRRSSDRVLSAAGLLGPTILFLFKLINHDMWVLSSSFIYYSNHIPAQTSSTMNNATQTPNLQ